MHKLKDVFHRTSPRNQDASRQHVERKSNDLSSSLPQTRGRAMSASHPKAQPHQSNGNRPSSASNRKGDIAAAHDYRQQESDPNEAAIKKDYKAYLPVLSSTNHPSNSQYQTAGGDARLVNAASPAKHHQDIANRNAYNYGPSSQPDSLHTGTNPGTRKPSHGIDSMGPAASSDPIGNVGCGSKAPSKNPMEKTVRKKLVAKNSIGDDLVIGADLRASIVHAVNPPVSESRYHNRADRSERAALDDIHSSHRRLPGRKSDSDHDKGKLLDIQKGGMSERGDNRPSEDQFHNAPDNGTKRHYIVKGAREPPSLEGIIDRNFTEDVDTETRWAPAITHEVVKPTEHHIREERIYRETHNYDVHHRIQPVYETVVLPARHFIFDESDKLVEVSADSFPESTGANQRWFIGEKDAKTVSRKPLSRPREPQIMNDITYMTPKGYERRETTILHPPTLADMSNYNGPVHYMHFDHGPDHKDGHGVLQADEASNNVLDADTRTLKELAKSLPTIPSSTPVPDQYVPARHSSIRKSTQVV